MCWCPGTLRDLVIGSGLEFEDRGAHELKGVPGDLHLFASPRRGLERWWFVALGDEGVVESAFGGNGFGGVVGAGVSASRHHRAAVGSGFG